MASGGHFAVMISGQIEYAEDWEVVRLTGEEASLESGMTQLSARKAGTQAHFVWNFPIEIAFKSSNPAGWPKIVLTISESRPGGKFPIVGYGWTHLPLFAGQHELEVPLFKPQPSSMIQAILGNITGNIPEFVTPQFVAGSEGREATRVASEGKIKLKLHVLIKDRDKFGYE